ncbi:hypothetical protein DFH27DRAFT_562616 [Peziza echinospora]|nr:hypothetical protein DFH27DRAFT_562616 [Peziza echinospora]
MQFKLSSTMLTFVLLMSYCHQGDSIDLPDHQTACLSPTTKCSSSDKSMEGCCPRGTTCCTGKSNYVCCRASEICYNTMRGEAFCRLLSPEPTNILTRID